MRRALITGVTGQDGSYLADLLLSKGYEVHGVVRQPAPLDTTRIAHLVRGAQAPGASFALHYMDLGEVDRLVTLLKAVAPHEVYHLSAPSHVRGILDDPDHVDDISGIDTTRLLEAIRVAGDGARFFQASSSDMYAAAPSPRDEEPPFAPRSLYGAAKVYSHWITKIYREAYGIFAVNGVLYDHDSPRRAEAFTTRRIARAAALASLGATEPLRLGDVDVPHDLGYAGDYVEAMWRMLQVDEPTDCVVATGRSSTLRDFLGYAYGAVNLDWRDHVVVAEPFPSPRAPQAPLGDPTKAERVLGWAPRTTVPELAELMVRADLDRTMAEAGHRG